MIMELAKIQMLAETTKPVRKSARRLRWFKDTLQQQINVMQSQSGVNYKIDDSAVHSLFLRWLNAFNAQKPISNYNREDFVNFAAGLMLRELIESKPVSIINIPKDADKTNPAYFWPEGYLYVALCLNIQKAVLEQDFDQEYQISPAMDDLRTWWSFKENVNEDKNLAISFFDLFAGGEPNWANPASFRSRTTDQISQKYFKKISKD